MHRRSVHPAFARAAVAALALWLAQAAFGQAGGIILYENGSPDMGLSYAGASARAQDAATAFTNPAGMTRIDDNALLLGVMSIISDIELDLDAPGTVSVPPGSTDGGGNIGQFAPGLGSFAVLSLNDELKLGFSVTALAANGVDYNQTWVGRAFVTENQVIVANFEPAIAYRINEWLSVGAGLNIAYMSLQQDLLASNMPGAPTIQIEDADDVAFGGSFGVMIEASERTRLGVFYRTELEFDLEGDIDAPIPASVSFDATMRLPQGINFGLYHELNERLALLADVGWTDWSAFSRIPTTVGPVSIDVDRDWDDTWRIGIGAIWEFSDDWWLTGGFGYDSSPVDADKLLPDIPVGEQYRFSVGLQHDFGQGKVFGLTYTLLYAPIDVDTVALPPDGAVVLDGEYDPSLVNIFGLTFGIRF